MNALSPDWPRGTRLVYGQGQLDAVAQAVGGCGTRERTGTRRRPRGSARGTVRERRWRRSTAAAGGQERNPDQQLRWALFLSPVASSPLRGREPAAVSGGGFVNGSGPGLEVRLGLFPPRIVVFPVGGPWRTRGLHLCRHRSRNGYRRPPPQVYPLR